MGYQSSHHLLWKRRDVLRQCRPASLVILPPVPELGCHKINKTFKSWKCQKIPDLEIKDINKTLDIRKFRRTPRLKISSIRLNSGHRKVSTNLKRKTNIDRRRLFIRWRPELKIDNRFVVCRSFCYENMASLTINCGIEVTQYHIQRLLNANPINLWLQDKSGYHKMTWL